MKRLSKNCVVLAGFAGLFFALFTAAEGQVKSKRVVESPESPKVIGPYSHAIIANGFENSNHLGI